MKTVVTGAGGRMGQAVLRALKSDLTFTVHAGTERSGSTLINTELAPGAKIHPSLEEALKGAEVVIDFSSAEASLEHARACAKARVPIVIGTTGLTDAQRAELADLGKSIAIVFSPNMSIGVNLMIEVAAQLAQRLGESFEVDILESHHRDKKDAPSGTALRLADEIAKATGRTKADYRETRSGLIGQRPRKEIGIQTLRGGDVVGEHTVFYFGDGERLELTHRASSRDQFAKGALRAAKWVAGRAPGLYSMSDVLKVNR